jgi:hypothetical protein
MVEADAKITGSIDVLVDYKKGGLTLAQAVDRFRKLTGLTPDVAEKFIRGMSRDNIISLQAKRNIHANKQEETDDREG